jgi:hypothetical protein
MPSMKLKDHIAQFIVLSPTLGEEVEFILGVNAPDDLATQVQTWWIDNPKATAKDAALWMQGKNWGVLADYEAISLVRPRKKS